MGKNEGNQKEGLCGCRWRWINREIDVPVRTEGIRLAYQPFCTERDTVLMAGIEFTGNQHQLQLFEQQRKRLVEMAQIRVAKLPGDTGAIGEIVQPVAFLHQASAKTGRDIAFKPPPGLSDIVVYCRYFIRQFSFP